MECLPDIQQQFVSIYEVVNGDEIKGTAKFPPEHELGHPGKENDEQQEKQSDAAEQLEWTPVVQLVRDDEPEEQHYRGDPGEGCGCFDGTEAKGFHQRENFPAESLAGEGMNRQSLQQGCEKIHPQQQEKDGENPAVQVIISGRQVGVRRIFGCISGKWFHSGITSLLSHKIKRN